MVAIVATLMDDAGKVVPIGGIAALLVVMLKMVWTNDSEQRRNESRLRVEFEAERKADDTRHAADIERLHLEYNSSITALKMVHSAELESLERRIKLLRDEAQEERRIKLKREVERGDTAREVAEEKVREHDQH
jgi:hypothetical protein